MDGIKKYDGSICKEGYYRFQTRSWFDLGRMRATANAEQCFALVEELRISGKHVLDDNFVCAKLDKLRILGGDDFVQMGMWYINSARNALVTKTQWSYVKKKYKLNTTNFLFLCNC